MSSPTISDNAGAGPSSSANPTDDVDDYFQIEEPSPLDKILADGRSYNGGNWSSEDLKVLFDGVYKYGAQKAAMSYVCEKMNHRKSEQEIQAKVDEIREIIKENKESILPEFYRQKWIEAGHRNILPPDDSEVNPNEGWCSIASKIVNHHHPAITKTSNPVKDTIERVLNDFSEKSKKCEKSLVTSLQTARATTTDTQTVRWPLIYQFMNACASIEEQMPAINELEAAIISKVLDTIEDEASTISNDEKAVMAGIFTECQLNDFRFVEQDFPASVQGGLQLLVDPLRTRAHGIPEVAAEVEVNANDLGPSTSSAASAAD